MAGAVREIKVKKEEVAESVKEEAVKEEPGKEDSSAKENTSKKEPEKKDSVKEESEKEKASEKAEPVKEEVPAEPEPEPDPDAPEETDPADRTDDLADVSFESVTEEPEKKGLKRLFGKRRGKKKAKGTGDAGGYVPGKKKFKIIWLVLPILVIAGVIFFLRNQAAKNAPPEVTVQEASLGSIEEIVSVSGTVASAEKQSYFAGISAPVKTLNIAIGDRVKKGDLLLLYDEEELELARKQAELNVQQAQGNYSGSMEKNAKATNVLRGNSIGDINNRLNEITAEIDAINLKITEKTDRLSGTITELQNTLQDINQNGIADSMENTYTAAWNDATGGDAEASTGYITRLESGTVNADSYASEQDRQMYLAVQQSLNDKQYALNHDAEIEAWQRQIQALNEEKSTLSEQKSVETSRLTGGEKSAMAAQKELTELSSADTISDIDAAEEGIKAGFAGVITELSVEEGATVAKGTKLLSIASTDDVEVQFQLAKADMNRIATGQAVDITVNGSSYEGEVIYFSG
ncbi:MAG: biotin/lipoyl-binding protein, partial [Lachnospiraceae bacterium]|nr:biotin/lipoyl-binding protein [Lachnospiraceae bacterium]